MLHYSDIIMRAMASHITSLTIVYSAVYSGTDQRKHQSSTSLAFVRGIHRWPVNSPHKGPVTRKMFPFDDVIMDPFVQILACHLFGPKPLTKSKLIYIFFGPWWTNCFEISTKISIWKYLKDFSHLVLVWGQSDIWFRAIIMVVRGLLP